MDWLPDRCVAVRATVLSRLVPREGLQEEEAAYCPKQPCGEGFPGGVGLWENEAQEVKDRTQAPECWGRGKAEWVWDWWRARWAQVEQGL